MPVFPTRDDYTPKRDPDTPPDSSDPTGPCPRCGRVSNFSVEGSAPVTFLTGVHVMTQEGRTERDDLQRAFSCAPVARSASWWSITNPTATTEWRKVCTTAARSTTEVFGGGHRPL